MDARLDKVDVTVWTVMVAVVIGWLLGVRNALVKSARGS